MDSDSHIITFREIRKEDYERLAKIISDTWQYETFCTPKTAKRASMLYLKSCLVYQSYNLVALCDGQPVGVIMANSEKDYHLPLRHVLSQIPDIVPMLMTPDGRRAYRMNSTFDAVNETMLEESEEDFSGELVLFILDEAYRGMGIGKQLLMKVENYMRQQRVRQFYLYTDNYCNYSFYEKHGFRRIAEKNLLIHEPEEEIMHMFLYKYRFQAER